MRRTTGSTLRASRAALARVALVMCAAFAGAGCDTGGLLVVEHSKPKPSGPSVNELSNAGTYAKNGKYQLYYSLGQGTPNQGPVTSETKRLNGGIVGAAQ